MHICFVLLHTESGGESKHRCVTMPTLRMQVEDARLMYSTCDLWY